MPWTQRATTFALLILSVICIPAPAIRLTPVDVTNAFASARLKVDLSGWGERGSRCGEERRRGLGADGRELPLCHSRESWERQEGGLATGWMAGGERLEIARELVRSKCPALGGELVVAGTLQRLKVRLEI